MCEILIRAKSNNHADPIKDLKCYKRGFPVVVMEDGHQWGNAERLPDFVVLKFPLVPKDSVLKYFRVQEIQNGFELDGTTPRMEMYRRRLWKIRVNDLPAGALNKLNTEGELTIKANANYNGDFDYTWTQVKAYFRNQETDQDETDDITP